MDWWLIALGVFLLFFLLPTMILSSIIYTKLLIRTTKAKWGRECSIPDDEEYRRMFDIGMAWHDRYAAQKRPVEIDSGRFHLCGEYFDFGADKAVIVIPGRMESLLYSYFFAEPYRAAGYNVLVIDNRAHGLSDGRINSLGYREYKDILAWCRLLHDTLGNRSVVLHGICIGSSTGLFAMTARRSPAYITALVAEGMYDTFGESFLNHMRVDKRPMFPFAGEVLFYIWAISGANVVTDGPIRRIRRMTRPVLFLHSRADVFSTPEKARELYERCSAPKRLVWFDGADHSRIRINHTARYDGAIADFLAALDGEKKTVDTLVGV
ncbi:MAG: alpha/beta hydrolase [Acutalibacteraceae bacterium]|jgi:alpha-beta hydrolase superfamily lysophospholipase